MECGRQTDERRLSVGRYAPAARGQSRSVLHVYSSESADVEYVTDAAVTRCGTLRLDVADDLPPGATPRTREIHAKMTFGGTEIKVSAVDLATGQSVGCTIDFLSQ